MLSAAPGSGDSAWLCIGCLLWRDPARGPVDACRCPADQRAACMRRGLQEVALNPIADASVSKVGSVPRLHMETVGDASVGFLRFNLTQATPSAALHRRCIQPFHAALL